MYSQFNRTTILITKLTLILLFAFSQSVLAAGGSRACRATGYFYFTFQEFTNNHMIRQQKLKINIRESDMHVVASQRASGLNWKKKAKESACKAASHRFVGYAGGYTGGTIVANYETIKVPKNMKQWRRKVACGWAKAGRVPGIKYSKKRTVKLYETKVVATGKRDNVVRKFDGAIREKHTCWSEPPRRTNPK